MNFNVNECQNVINDETYAPYIDASSGVSISIVSLKKLDSAEYSGPNWSNANSSYSNTELQFFLSKTIWK